MRLDWQRPVDEQNPMIRIVTFSSLYPSSVKPNHGIFVETRLRELLKTGEVEARVVAPVPWFFSTDPKFGDYARMARTPSRETLNGIDIQHPRYFLPPKIGMNVSPFLMAVGAARALRRLLDEGYEFDLIDAHYFYPDGVAAALLAKWFKKPFVVTARGSDINQISDYSIPRKLIVWASRHAHASIAVSNALSNKLARIGAERSKLVVLRNGVDTQRFRPVPMADARVELGWPDEPTLLSVGNLVESKGHHIAIELLTRSPGFRLSIVGHGPERESLERLARRLGVTGRVMFAGQVAQERLPIYYSAADILILASSREGWPNVLLESMACGTPVLSTNVGGIPEILTVPTVGRLTADRSAVGFSALLEDLWAHYPARSAVRGHAERFSWNETALGQFELFAKVLNA